MVAALEKASFVVSSVRTSNTDNEKDKIYADFNDPDSGVEVLVLNMAITAAGLNLHKCCCDGIIIMEGWNKPLTFQVWGRLWRIGQLLDVVFRMLRVVGTYYDVLEDKANRKYCEQLRNECVMPKHFRKHIILQRIYVYELCCQQFGSGFNRFIWVILPPKGLADYNSKGMIRAGGFLTLVLMELLSLVPEGGFVGDDSEAEIQAAEAADIVVKHIKRALMAVAMSEEELVERLDIRKEMPRLGDAGFDYGRAQAPF